MSKTTGNDGKVFFDKSMPVGEINFIVSKDGYQSKEGTFNITTEEKSNALNIKLCKRQDPLNPRGSNSDSSSTTTETKFGYFTDERDGKKYKTVRHNGKTWLAENANYEVAGSRFLDGDYQLRVYNWESAIKSVPNGWRLPTKHELEEVENEAKSYSNPEDILLRGDLHLHGPHCIFYKNGSVSISYSNGNCIWSGDEIDVLFSYALIFSSWHTNVGGISKDSGMIVRWVKK